MVPYRRPFPRSTPVGLERLRQRIREMDGSARRFGGPAASGRAPAQDTGLDDLVRFGADDVDTFLPWGGLPRDALHEVVAGESGAASTFAAALCARRLAAARGRASRDNAILWCESRHVLDSGRLYVPGLARLGLHPGRVVCVRVRRDQDLLWAMEEGLRHGRMAAIVGEADEVSLTASRRLQLAAEEGGVPAFLLRPKARDGDAGAALTRWRITALPSVAEGEAGEPGFGKMRWRADLIRCRGGETRSWNLEWCDETGDFAVPAPARDRPFVPVPARMAG